MRTDEQATKQAKKIIAKKSDDTEILHAELDDLLCEILKEQGFKNLVKEYKKPVKWYA